MGLFGLLHELSGLLFGLSGVFSMGEDDDEDEDEDEGPEAAGIFSGSLR